MLTVIQSTPPSGISCIAHMFCIHRNIYGPTKLAVSTHRCTPLSDTLQAFVVAAQKVHTPNCLPMFATLASSRFQLEIHISTKS